MHCLIINKLATAFSVLIELIDPNLSILFEATGKDSADAFIKLFYPND